MRADVYVNASQMLVRPSVGAAALQPCRARPLSAGQYGQDHLRPAALLLELRADMKTKHCTCCCAALCSVGRRAFILMLRPFGPCHVCYCTTTQCPPYAAKARSSDCTEEAWQRSSKLCILTERDTERELGQLGRTSREGRWVFDHSSAQLCSAAWFGQSARLAGARLF